MAVAIAAAIAATIGSAAAYVDGAPTAHSGGFGEANCNACHSDNPLNEQPGSLTITGLPARYRPGARYELTLELMHPALASGGFQLSLRTPDGSPAGRIAYDSPRVQRITGNKVEYLQHTRAGSETGTAGRISWSFAWQAPEQATDVILHVAANAANDDMSDLGDRIYTLKRHIRVAAAEPVEDPGAYSSAASRIGSSRKR
jgi:hypothetical protein